ncbi:hypothetical protein BKA57DRAFT_478366 [Linnemannia elongata]|nr:hypothetical protein BKA57DRAFT_478366 [Linnemannia elongata]
MWLKSSFISLLHFRDCLLFCPSRSFILISSTLFRSLPLQTTLFSSFLFNPPSPKTAEPTLRFTSLLLSRIHCEYPVCSSFTIDHLQAVVNIFLLLL